MTEADDILFDIESNLLPLLQRFMKIHASRWIEGDKQSGKHLKSFHRSLVQHIHTKQPMPVMEGVDD